MYQCILGLIAEHHLTHRVGQVVVFLLLRSFAGAWLHSKPCKFGMHWLDWSLLAGFCQPHQACTTSRNLPSHCNRANGACKRNFHEKQSSLPSELLAGSVQKGMVGAVHCNAVSGRCCASYSRHLGTRPPQIRTSICWGARQQTAQG